RREIGEIFDTREAIEAHVAAAAAESIDSIYLDELRRTCARLLEIGKSMRRYRRVDEVDRASRLAWYEADLGFHRILLNAVGNRWLARVYADLQLLTQTCGERVMDRTFTPAHLVAVAYREHMRI